MKKIKNLFLGFVVLYLIAYELFETGFFLPSKITFLNITLKKPFDMNKIYLKVGNEYYDMLFPYVCCSSWYLNYRLKNKNKLIVSFIKNKNDYVSYYFKNIKNNYIYTKCSFKFIELKNKNFKGLGVYLDKKSNYYVEIIYTNSNYIKDFLKDNCKLYSLPKKVR